MTTEQLKELGEALSILSAKSSVLKERNELRSLMEENLLAEEVAVLVALSKMTLIDHQTVGPQITFWGADEAYS